MILMLWSVPQRNDSSASINDASFIYESRTLCIVKVLLHLNCWQVPFIHIPWSSVLIHLVVRSLWRGHQVVNGNCLNDWIFSCCRFHVKVMTGL